MTRTLVSALLITLSFQAIAQGSAKSAAIEYRKHFVLRAEDKTLLYEFTEMVRLTDDVDQSRLLVHDEGHGDFILSNTWDFTRQTVTARLNDVSDRAFLQRSYKTPFTSRTRLETLKEGKSNPKVTNAPVTLTIESGGGVWNGTQADWDEPLALRSLRHQIRTTLNPFLLEGLERMRGTLTESIYGAKYYDAVAHYVVYAGKDDVKFTVHADEAPPDCDFDKAFGFPCSDKQIERLAKAAQEGRIPSHY